MDFVASSALIHFPFAVAPKKYPNSTATIGWRSAAIATLPQTDKALSAITKRTSFTVALLQSMFDRQHNSVCSLTRIDLTWLQARNNRDRRSFRKAVSGRICV